VISKQSTGKDVGGGCSHTSSSIDCSGLVYGTILTCLEGRRENRSLNQDSQCPVQDLNQAPPKFRFEVFLLSVSAYSMELVANLLNFLYPPVYYVLACVLFV